jgi:hypothetical protein
MAGDAAGGHGLHDGDLALAAPDAAQASKAGRVTWSDLLVALWPAVIGALVLAAAGWFAWEDRLPPPRPGE